MAYPDPQTVDSASLPRTGMGATSGEFQTGDGTRTLAIAHTYGRRVRRAVSLVDSKVSSDPLVPSQNVRSSMKVSIVVDVPVNGYSVAEEKLVVDALVAWAAATSGANITRLLGGES